MSTIGSVTLWIKQLRQGEESGLLELHQRYWPRLVAWARRRLNVVPNLVIHDEEVAEEAFWSFFHGMQAGKLPRLANRQHLGAFLSHVTACRAVNLIVRETHTEKRPRNRLPAEAGLLDLLQSREPGPEEQAILNDLGRHFIDGLEEKLRPFAELYLAGYTYREIAQRLDCVEKTVERKIPLILQRWQAMASACAEDLLP